MDRIAANWTNVAMPVLDNIHDTTFQFIVLDHEVINVGGFSWTMAFNWIPIRPEEMERRKKQGMLQPVRYETISSKCLNKYLANYKMYGQVLYSNVV